MKFNVLEKPNPLGSPSSFVNLLNPSYGHTPLNVIESPKHKMFIFLFGAVGL